MSPRAGRVVGSVFHDAILSAIQGRFCFRPWHLSLIVVQISTLSLIFFLLTGRPLPSMKSQLLVLTGQSRSRATRSPFSKQMLDARLASLHMHLPDRLDTIVRVAVSHLLLFGNNDTTSLVDLAQPDCSCRRCRPPMAGGSSMKVSTQKYTLLLVVGISPCSLSLPLVHTVVTHCKRLCLRPLVNHGPLTACHSFGCSLAASICYRFSPG
jgi:hypothetical protein